MYNTFNGYMQGVQPYGNPYADRLAAMQQNQAIQQRCDVVTVNGENGAQAYPLAPNSSALLLDESQPLVWLVKTDELRVQCWPVSVLRLQQLLQRLITHATTARISTGGGGNSCSR